MALIRELVGAVLLGIGTVFGLKGETESHWTDPPNLVVEMEEATEETSSRDRA